MRITLEADYAVRIIYVLAEGNKKISSSEISELTGVSLRFSLKILRKLTNAGLVKSFKGSAGGYILLKQAKEITLFDVICAIDGEININHCLGGEFVCTKPTDNGCNFKSVFFKINDILKNELMTVNFEQLL